MTFREFWQPLTAIYPESEARWIGRFVFEERYGLSQADLLMGRETCLDGNELKELQRRLLTGEPVQYVIGLAPFGGRLFTVTPDVLIPRPETLWLCQAAIDFIGRLDADEAAALPAVLDIGTGSGCIAITIALAAPKSPLSSAAPEIPLSSAATITAWDISAEVLTVARTNAERLHASVTFEQQDMLCPPDDTDRWNAIVSNPPYICEQEKAAMERNVLDYEPAQALFVPDEAPLLYYRAIGQYAVKALRPGGCLFLEINPLYAHPLVALLLEQGFADARIHQDDNDKDRYITAWKESNR